MRFTPESLPFLCLLLFVDAATISSSTTPLLLFYGRYHEPWQVAVFGAVASAFGSAIQLRLIRWAMDSGQRWIHRLAPSRERLTAALAAYPSASFMALLVARATPLPDAPLKLVAAAVRYPVYLYGLATLLGSIPYYFVLALIGHKFRLPAWVFLVAAGVIVAGLVFDRVRRGRRRAPAS